ncbi:lipopolysaccharide heptosyltransferase RfaC [Candidatus Profftia tarda]|nr:lipopolysaccharide heptosyltransferase RfaC [Candidatus Profftia tarda]
MHVLIVKTSSMGDIINTLPALSDAAHAIPNIKFDWVVEEDFAQIPYWHPAVNRVIPVAFRRWRKNWFSTTTRQERYNFRKEIQCRHYHAVIDAQGLMKSAALITRIAKGPIHGEDYRSSRELFASCFFTHTYRISKKIHAVERIRELFAFSLKYKKPESINNTIPLELFLKRLPPDYDRYLVFLHSTTRNDKHWPTQHWRDLIALTESTGIKIKLPWGTKYEQERAMILKEGFQNVEVLPRLSLEQVAEVIVGAKALVSVDTGLSHLASALDRPNITLYGPTDPQLIGTYGKNQIVYCSANKKMSELRPNIVIKLLLYILYLKGTL